MSFDTFKKNRTTELANIQKKLAEMSKSKFQKDERFWNPTLDKAGNGSALIRFLPAAEGEDVPWVQYCDHNFEIDGSYFVEKCLDSKGRDCPICKWLKPYWKQAEDGDTEAKEITGTRKKKKHYIANIMVLKDKENPENEGKVFLYKFGVKIYEKIMAQLNPKDEDDAPIAIYDFWDGADFKLDIKKVQKFNNYDDSAFKAPSPLLKGDDKKLKEVYDKLYLLNEFVDDKLFKSFDDLKAKYLDFIGTSNTGKAKSADELFQKSDVKSTAKKNSARLSKPVVKDDEPDFSETEATQEELDGLDGVVDDELSAYEELANM
jgi:hypothetical protein